MVEITLTITSPGGTKQVPMTGDALTIGRTDASAVVIADDSGLSRRHVTIHREADHVWIAEEGSTNGSYLNGEKVSQEGGSLSDGDEINIGNHTTIMVSIKSDQKEISRAPQATSAPPTTNPSLMKFLIPAIAVVMVILGAVGFGLYKATRSPAPLDQSLNEPLSEPSTEETADAKDTKDTAPTSEVDSLSAVTSTPAPQASILSTDFNTQSAPVDEAPPTQRKLYKDMSEEEKKEFTKQRAQHIAIMMGKRPYAFTPDALVHIKFWLDAFARRIGNKRTGLWGGDTIAILERGKIHAPIIIRAFKEHRVPYVVGLYIPFIETEYTNIATNNFAGAAGLFQFLGPTAEHYGVPSSERTNVVKMAPAAARYFRDNIMSFGDDSMSVALSIAGYNRAPESVKRDLRNVLNAQNNEDKERSFWTLIANQGKLDEYFQKENINYVPRFFAAAILGETPWAFGIDMRPLSTYTQITTPTESVPTTESNVP